MTELKVGEGPTRATTRHLLFDAAVGSGADCALTIAPLRSRWGVLACAGFTPRSGPVRSLRNAPDLPDPTRLANRQFSARDLELT